MRRASSGVFVNDLVTTFSQLVARSVGCAVGLIRRGTVTLTRSNPLVVVTTKIALFNRSVVSILILERTSTVVELLAG